MPGIAITPFYAAALGLLFILLSLRVIAARRRAGVALGVVKESALERRVRVHANFAEYVPLALLLVLFVELAGHAAWLVHLIAGSLTLGRLLHAYGVSQVREDFRLRTIGMALTFAAIGSAAMLLIGRTWLTAG